MVRSPEQSIIVNIEPTDKGNAQITAESQQEVLALWSGHLVYKCHPDHVITENETIDKAIDEEGYTNTREQLANGATYVHEHNKPVDGKHNPDDVWPGDVIHGTCPPGTVAQTYVQTKTDSSSYPELRANALDGLLGVLSRGCRIHYL